MTTVMKTRIAVLVVITLFISPIFANAPPATTTKEANKEAPQPLSVQIPLALPEADFPSEKTHEAPAPDLVDDDSNEPTVMLRRAIEEQQRQENPIGTTYAPIVSKEAISSAKVSLASDHFLEGLSPMLSKDSLPSMAQ